ncbi:MAG TPA: hypothetical protein VL989_00800, partial [Candidatus Sulfotelmatobacter sp.]|nr:hypothetical protein [Candidatus Sulfotelmatobacter sp.]
VKDFVVQENISDDLDYADPVSLGGGTLASSGVLSWPAQTVAAKSSVTETYTLQVKNPVPTTPAGTDNPDGYNFVMTDVYGNTININVAKPATVAVAQTAATSLPNTGPGAGVFIFAALAVASGYLYFRSRLLVSESAIAIDYAGKNGGDDE